MRTKQQNWVHRKDVTAYSVFDGRLFSPLVDVFNAFCATGAVGTHVLVNSLRYVVNRGGRAAG
jgi:hypothetical protein